MYKLKVSELSHNSNPPQVACTSELHYLDYSVLLYTLLARTYLHGNYTTRDVTSRDVSRDTAEAARYNVSDNVTLSKGFYQCRIYRVN